MTLRKMRWTIFTLFAAAIVAGQTRISAAPSALSGSPFARVVADVPAAKPNDVTAGNRVALLSHGYDALLLRIHLIRAATRSIDIQTFIWTNDEVGRLMIWELLQAARRGVKVRIIADHLFSDQEPDIVAFLASANPRFEVRHYRPATSRMKPGLWRTLLAGARSFHDVNQRMHSKVMIVDDAVLITGGRNVENTYYDHSLGLNFRDRDVVAVGPLVATAVEEFEAFWTYRFTVPSRDLVDVRAALQRGTFRRFDRREDYDFGGYFTALDAEADRPDVIETRFIRPLKAVQRARFLYDAPGKSHRTSAQSAEITRELGAIVAGAKTSVLLQTPYLVLSRPARGVFHELRTRTPAVEIRVSTNSFASTDNLTAYSANYRLRNEYIEGLGLAIYELKSRPGELLEIFPRFPEMSRLAREQTGGARPTKDPFLSLHAKSLVVDDTLGFVGSFNLDPRSERLNTEVGLLVIDGDFARALRAEIERDMQPENSWVIGRRRLPLRLEAVNGLVDSLLSLSPIDLWPIQNTSSFDLLPGLSPVRPDDPAFHQHYREVGSFPGADGVLSDKEIFTRLLKAVGAPLTPIM